MEGSSTITDSINDTRHFENHPGTMNFKFRLMEAQRIHNRNMILAARLDSIQPYYKMSDIYVAEAIKRKPKKKPTKFARELEYAMNEMRGDTAPNSTRSESPTTDYLKGFNFANSSTISAQHSSLSARQSTDVQYSRQKPHTVLLEYTKVQDGRVLSVAVLKEPFRDRYAIFGIDVDVGQRYELRLTSDEVSSILDGDILVTSVDNVEVWMALLNKVSLNKVDDFAKLPFTGEEVDLFNASNGEPKEPISMPISNQNQSQQQGLVASRPTTERPSSRATTSRGGARSRGGAAAAASSSENRSVSSAATAGKTATAATVATTVSAIASESAASPTTKEVSIKEEQKAKDSSEKGPESPEPKRPAVPKLNLNSQTVGSNRLAMAKHRPEVPSSSAATKMANTSPRTNKAPVNSNNKNPSPVRGAVAPTATVTSPTPAAAASNKPATQAAKPAATATTAAAPVAAKGGDGAAATVTSPVAATAPTSAKPLYVRKSIRESPNKGSTSNNSSNTATTSSATQKSAASPAPAAGSSSVKDKPTAAAKTAVAAAPVAADPPPKTERPKTALELIVGEAFIESAVMQAISNVCNATERAAKSRKGSKQSE